MGLFYYILVDDDTPNRCKLGVTKDPEQRLRSYRTGAPQSRYLKVYKDIDRRHEKLILELLKDILRVKNEVVYGNPEMVKNHVEGYFDDQGIEY